MDQSNLQQLSSRPERPGNCVLSVCLNVDQSQQANLNRGFENQLKDMTGSLRKTISEASELEQFQNAVHRVEDFVSSYGIGARGLVIFFDASDGFFWHAELQMPVENMARWNRRLFLQPLAEALDEAEAYTIALVGEASLRLFVVCLGEIEELAEETFPSREVRHIRTVGTDHAGSASHVQRKADEHIRWNLRQIVRSVNLAMQSKQISRLILAGTPQITAQLRKSLPKTLVRQIIGSITISTDASARQVLSATEPIAQEYERATELKLVNNVMTESAKGRNAVTGLSSTLKAIYDARVWQLIYSDEFHCSGFECAKCKAMFAVERGSCLYCGAELHPVTNVVEHAVEHALRKGAIIEVVKDEASAVLANAGGIAAFLKTRTASVQV